MGEMDSLNRIFWARQEIFIMKVYLPIVIGFLILLIGLAGLFALSFWWRHYRLWRLGKEENRFDQVGRTDQEHAGSRFRQRPDREGTLSGDFPFSHLLGGGPHLSRKVRQALLLSCRFDQSTAGHFPLCFLPLRNRRAHGDCRRLPGHLPEVHPQAFPSRNQTRQPTDLRLGIVSSCDRLSRQRVPDGRCRGRCSSGLDYVGAGQLSFFTSHAHPAQHPAQ